MVYTVEHFCNGKRFHHAKEVTHNLINPATGKIQGEVFYACAETIEDTVAAAKSAYLSWSQSTLTKRTEVLFNYKNLLGKYQNELAQLITKEHGKTLSDALGSIQRGLAVVDYACGIAHHLKGEFSLDASTGIDCYSIRQPIGVCVGITPFNFPAMIPLWMFPLAIACGNTFILKPSEKDPSCPLRLVEIMQEAGLPDGVLNVIHGGEEVVTKLLSHPDVNAISFVGSTPVAEFVYATAVANHKRVQAFGGAKNHCIVMPDADIDYASNAIMGAAFGSAGERCMAISVVIAIDKIADELIAKLSTKIADLKIGPGDENVDMGPLITQQHLDKVKQYIETGLREGAELLVDGREKCVANGHFLGACLFDQVTAEMKIYQEEIFGPVLAVVRAKDFASAIDLINKHPFGNGAAIFTQDPLIGRRFAKQVNAGMVGINIPIPVPIAQYSFGGWKRSFFGDIPMHGMEGIRFYTKLKTITEKWPDVAHHQPEYKMPTID